MSFIKSNEKGEKLYKYSEIFHSIQGEGYFTGVPTAWVRFFLCNLTCDGFGQKDPTDASTYHLPYQQIDAKSIKRIEDLPVFEHGCDSSYSWSAKFKHLQHSGTATEICNTIQDSMKHPKNPEGLFAGSSDIYQPSQHLCFTGGEPLMKHSQPAIAEILEELVRRSNIPGSITFETNGTQPLSEQLIDMLITYNSHCLSGEIPFFFSVSPKLFSVAGEPAERAIKPDTVGEYAEFADVLGGHGQLKFVVNGTERAWDELETTIRLFREAGVYWPVWIMPVSATLEGQQGELEGYMSAGEIATEAFKRGYNVSSRVHVYLWGNALGT